MNFPGLTTYGSNLCNVYQATRPIVIAYYMVSALRMCWCDSWNPVGSRFSTFAANMLPQDATPAASRYQVSPCQGCSDVMTMIIYDIETALNTSIAPLISAAMNHPTRGATKIWIAPVVIKSRSNCCRASPSVSDKVQRWPLNMG